MSQQNKPSESNVVETLAEIFHNVELVDFSNNYKTQERNGFKDRIVHQKRQLQSMRHGETLDDPDF